MVQTLPFFDKAFKKYFLRLQKSIHIILSYLFCMLNTPVGFSASGISISKTPVVYV
jgi:hypothetical protein